MPVDENNVLDEKDIEVVILRNWKVGTTLPYLLTYSIAFNAFKNALNCNGLSGLKPEIKELVLSTRRARCL